MSRLADVDTSSLKPLSLSASNIKVFGRHFIDQHGRILHLRGANVGAASKVPNNPRPSIHDHAQSSYVGRPFSLDEAPKHWRRLKSWGLTFVRINVTWDAIEHAGRGQYDEAYLEYLKGLLQSMSDHGLVAYISIHQDVWSRYCGGSGAPGWTLEVAGFDLSSNGEKLALSGAAFVDGIKGDRLQGERGLWPTGYQKLACASMNTFFWGGKMFAPSLLVQDGDRKVNIQQYLQDAFLKAFEQLVDAVGDLPGVLGFELMNEPHPGFIGLPTIDEWNYNTDLHLGDFPSAVQSMSMGAGHPTPNVPHYARSFPFPTRMSKKIVGNPTGASAWSGPCPWETEGVWRWSEAKKTAVVLQENYFIKGVKGRDVDFYQDCYWPFLRKWEAMIERKTRDKKGKMRMVEVVPNEFCPDWPEGLTPNNFVFAPHWYDINTLFKKTFGNLTVNVQGLSRGHFVFKCLYWGLQVKTNYALQIRNIVENARKKLGEVPIVFGECGVPMDMNNEQAFRTGDWKWQNRMMDAMISAFESSLVGFNLWTYNPSNRDDIGDDWNAENFSWYSDHNRRLSLQHNDVSDLDTGARLLDTIVRPYAVATAGTPLSHEYDASTSLFTYRLRSPIRLGANSSEEMATSAVPATAHITEIFLPRRLYTEGKVEFQLSMGGRLKFDFENERAYLWFSDAPSWVDRQKADKIRRIDIWVKGRRAPQDQYGVGTWLGIALAVILGILATIYAQRLQWGTDQKLGLTIGKYWI